MTMLESLVRAYDRLAATGEVAPFGYSPEKIGYKIELELDGSVRGKPTMCGSMVKSKHVPAVLQVPQGNKRTVGIDPNFLWDKTSYVLGVTGGLDKLNEVEREKRLKRVAAEHAAFVARHLRELASTDDEALLALRAFLTHWSPDHFAQLDWPLEMLDQNVVFAFGFGDGADLHERQAARDLWTGLADTQEHERIACLVTGETAPAARLHPSVKGVPGAQSSGASLVSFNKDAFTSYGHDQGDNAPVSAVAAFAYGTALNHLLRRDANGSWPNRVTLGDTVAVFWAEAPNPELGALAEGVFSASFGGFEIDAHAEASKVSSILEAIRDGRPINSVEPDLQDGVTFNILGLAPNAARLSVRFWLQDSFGRISERFSDFCQDIAIEPGDKQDGPIALWKLVRETAVLGKDDNVSPLLAGEWLRAILSGARYPQTLLASVLARIRADGEVNARRAAILKAVLIRNFHNKEAPVAFDPENTNRGYLLGRLFATYARIQEDALGGDLNSSVKDKYYGSASAQPRKVFRLLDANSTSHQSKLRKDKPGVFVVRERLLQSIMAMMSPGDDPYPVSLSAEEQALFGLGYYHQRSEFFRSKPTADTTITTDEGH
jgi:CRISPR-associated protein Csd1